MFTVSTCIYNNLCMHVMLSDGDRLVCTNRSRSRALTMSDRVKKAFFTLNVAVSSLSFIDPVGDTTGSG